MMAELIFDCRGPDWGHIETLAFDPYSNVVCIIASVRDIIRAEFNVLWRDFVPTEFLGCASCELHTLAMILNVRDGRILSSSSACSPDSGVKQKRRSMHIRGA